ncbi:class I SAM-dependent methyltransferase [Rubripirellula tenax]|nr:class I SAM-dependent methyltransferase [Rubripirellula tenax]
MIRHVEAGQLCCDPVWEAAYERFETPEEEIAKFIKRLRKFGVDQLDKQSSVIELFCGRGGGLVALQRLGFTNVEGVDLSDTLLESYRGPAQLHLADCRSLPMSDATYDIAIVQGGLHHLPNLPDDLNESLSETRRILKPGGRLYVIEPWMTPFLRIAHAITDQPIVRKLYAKGDALATMTEHESETYFQWLGMPDVLMQSFSRYFDTVQCDMSWGKLAYVGKPR